MAPHPVRRRAAVSPLTARLSVRVEGREERVLERRVLHRLLQVAVHLAGGGEDALDASRPCSRRGGRGWGFFLPIAPKMAARSTA